MSAGLNADDVRSQLAYQWDSFPCDVLTGWFVLTTLAVIAIALVFRSRHKADITSGYATELIKTPKNGTLVIAISLFAMLYCITGILALFIFQTVYFLRTGVWCPAVSGIFFASTSFDSFITGWNQSTLKDWKGFGRIFIYVVYQAPLYPILVITFSGIWLALWAGVRRDRQLHPKIDPNIEYREKQADKRCKRVEQLKESADRIRGYFYPEKPTSFSAEFSNNRYAYENEYEAVFTDFTGKLFLSRNGAPFSERKGVAHLFYAYEFDNMPVNIKDFEIHLLGHGDFGLPDVAHGRVNLKLAKVDLYPICKFIAENLGKCRITFWGPIPQDVVQVQFWVDSFKIETCDEPPSLAELNAG